MGPIDYGLHLIFLTTVMSSCLYRLNVATISSLLYRLGYKSALVPLREEVLRIACELKKQFTLIVNLQRLLADQRFSNLVVVKQERFSHVLQKKTTEKSHE